LKLLLDTHIALWAIADDWRLNDLARSLIDDPENEVMVSAATVWEISIKHALARSNMPISGEEALRYFRSAEFMLLGITPVHAAAVETLPPLHADPFDRILIAQAMTEPARLLTRDAQVAAYGAMVLVV
jgi:PIN domain nuclease of toxin-antitoxin system